MKLVADVEAFVKKGDADVVEAAKFTLSTILPELVKVQADASTIEAIAGLAGPEAAKVATAGMGLVAWAVKVINATDAAALDKGVNVTVDSSLLSAVKSVTSLFPASVTVTKAA